MIAKRVGISAVIVAIVFSVIFFLPNWVFCILVSALTGLSLYEFYGLVGRKGIFVYRYFGVIVGMLLPLIMCFQMSADGLAMVGPFFIVLSCLGVFILQLIKQDEAKGPLDSIAVTMLGLMYISWFLSFFVVIKYLPNGTEMVSFLVIVTKSSDIGAFFVGSSMGTHSLIPRVSPRKTVEGSVGGIVLAVIMSIICKRFLPLVPVIQLVALGVLLSVLGQVGDLAESLLKRDCGSKDSGTILPGYGGMLDMLDSLLFTAPIFYFYVRIFL